MRNFTQNDSSADKADESVNTTRYPALPLPENKAWPALVALCIGFFMILLDQTIVAVATPALQKDMGASYNQVIWVTSVYLLTFAVPLLVTGRLGDRYGPKRIYALGMIIFTLSSLACGFASSMIWLIVARATQGIGAALLTPQTMSVINRIFSIERRGAALGVWGTTAGLATLTGPVVGGMITQSWGWQWIFFINVPIGVVSVLAVLRYVPRFAPYPRPLDPLSVLLSIAAVFLVVYALQEGQTAHWAWWIWMLMAMGILLVGAFVYQQHRSAQGSSQSDPLIPLDIFKTKNFSLGNIGIVAMGFCVAGTPLPMMLYFQQVHGMSPFKAGLMMVPQAAISALLSPAIGRAVDRINPNALAAWGFGVMALSFGILGFLLSGWTSPWAIIPVLLLLGLGNSLVWAPNSASTMRDLPARFMGAGSGVYNTTRQIGSVLGSAAVGALMQIFIAAGAGDQAFGHSLWLAAAVLIVGVISSFLAQDASPEAVRNRMGLEIVA